MWWHQRVGRRLFCQFGVSSAVGAGRGTGMTPCQGLFAYVTGGTTLCFSGWNTPPITCFHSARCVLCSTGSAAHHTENPSRDSGKQCMIAQPSQDTTHCRLSRCGLVWYLWCSSQKAGGCGQGLTHHSHCKPADALPTLMLQYCCQCRCKSFDLENGYCGCVLLSQRQARQHHECIIKVFLTSSTCTGCPGA